MKLLLKEDGTGSLLMSKADIRAFRAALDHGPSGADVQFPIEMTTDTTADEILAASANHIG